MIQENTRYKKQFSYIHNLVHYKVQEWQSHSNFPIPQQRCLGETSVKCFLSVSNNEAIGD